jgi:hypothetical protein
VTCPISASLPRDTLALHALGLSPREMTWVMTATSAAWHEARLRQEGLEPHADREPTDRYGRSGGGDARIGPAPVLPPSGVHGKDLARREQERQIRSSMYRRADRKWLREHPADWSEPMNWEGPAQPVLAEPADLRREGVLDRYGA